MDMQSLNQVIYWMEQGDETKEAAAIREVIDERNKLVKLAQDHGLADKLKELGIVP